MFNFIKCEINSIEHSQYTKSKHWSRLALKILFILPLGKHIIFFFRLGDTIITPIQLWNTSTTQLLFDLLYIMWPYIHYSEAFLQIALIECWSFELLVKCILFNVLDFLSIFFVLYWEDFTYGLLHKHKRLVFYPTHARWTFNLFWDLIYSYSLHTN